MLLLGTHWSQNLLQYRASFIDWRETQEDDLMPTLAQELGDISHCSVLLRSVRNFGLSSAEDFIRLAIARGCRHYAPAFPPLGDDPGIAAVPNEELVCLLLLGSNDFEPIAIRCAAQLACECAADRLAHVAKRERVGRSLAYIARAGIVHDPSNEVFWKTLLAGLGEQPPVSEGVLPHWSRFVSQTGVTRYGGGEVQWLHCQ